jgi:hypothetical protein
MSELERGEGCRLQATSLPGETAENCLKFPRGNLRQEFLRIRARVRGTFHRSFRLFRSFRLSGGTFHRRATGKCASGCPEAHRGTGNVPSGASRHFEAQEFLRITARGGGATGNSSQRSIPRCMKRVGKWRAGAAVYASMHKTHGKVRRPGRRLFLEE